MSRKDQRLRASIGVPRPRAARAPEAPPPAPVPCSCGCVHDPEQMATNNRLAQMGILEMWGPEGDLRFRGDLSQVPSEFLIDDAVNEALTDGAWHRITVVNMSLRLYETDPILARLASAFFQPQPNTEVRMIQ